MTSTGMKRKGIKCREPTSTLVGKWVKVEEQNDGGTSTEQMKTPTVKSPKLLRKCSKPLASSKQLGEHQKKIPCKNVKRTSVLPSIDRKSTHHRKRLASKEKLGAGSLQNIASLVMVTFIF